ncbi:LytTR family DNA-binding domain-containing protein [Hyphococcus flavus]|uniref:LytTR family DNA-binding domain-containing protein n=1 Tax=Hyphococcus flavus TaxID=1866326 RepID=A0AAE9ZHX1_9PROT|nr:LytTR family DNA-binding domain-containing protein [Hyphococcus flavus]WDI32932.1 LytTR family DNA-binding domain-containing protein [Hyphococcus flavus]
MRFFKSRPGTAYLEPVIWITLCSGWIWLMARGDSNGFGYFSQPQNSLVAPLIIGGLINAVLFVTNAYYVVPKFLACGRWRTYLFAISALLVASVLLQTATQRLIIVLAEPDLRSLTWPALIMENLYLAPFVLLTSTLYKFGRDWARHLRERRMLENEAASLKKALSDTQKEMHAFASGGAPGQNFLQIESGSESVQIPVDAILFVQSAGNYANVVTGEKTFMAYGALKDLIERLPETRFARAHRSYIVGMDHIKAIKGDQLSIGEQELPIGASYKKDFMAKWKARKGTA